MQDTRTLTANINRIETTLRDSMPRWAALVPRHVDQEQMLSLVVNVLKQTPQLLECDQAGLWSAIITACKLGLKPDGLLGEAYLIPYGRQVKLVIGYKGLLSLARRSGNGLKITADVVREGDEFAYSMGDNEFINHTPATSATRSEQPITHVYAIVTQGDNTTRRVMDWAAIEHHRDQYAKASSRGPWATAPEQMAKKTVIRSLLNSGVIELSTELRDTIGQDGEVATVTGANMFDELINQSPLDEPAAEAWKEKSAAAAPEPLLDV